MKIYFKHIIAGIATLSAMSACNSDFLEQKTLTNIGEKDVFTDSLYTLGIVNGLYNDIEYAFKNTRFGNGGYEIGIDEAEPYRDVSQWSYMFSKGSINPSNINKTPWTLTYEKIREANLFLKNKDIIPVTPATLNYWEGQVRFLRAWFIFQQVKHYGGVPLVYDQVFTDQDNVQFPRNTYEECINYLVSECDAAAKNLPYTINFREAGEGGKATKGAALALKARILLYAASPLTNCSRADDPNYYVSYGNEDKERWKKAYQAALVLMNEGVNTDDPKEFEYALYQYPDDPSLSFYNLFLQSEPCAENIFSYWPANSTNNKMLLETHCNPPSRATRYYSGRSTGFPTQQLVDAFPMLDGTPINEAGANSTYPYPGTGDGMYENRDPRLAATVAYNGMERYIHQGPAGSKQWTYTAKTYPTGDLNLESARKDAIYAQGATRTGYYRMKGMSKNVTSSGELYRPSILIRYAEILLNAAEAANEYYERGSAELNKAYECLREIRKRAGIEEGDASNKYGIKDNMTREEMRTFIHNERRIELAFEEHRYWDVRRWHAFEEEGLTKYWTKGLEITRGDDDTYSYRTIEVEERKNEAAHYWWPIPASEITKNPAVVQNPGY